MQLKTIMEESALEQSHWNRWGSYPEAFESHNLPFNPWLMPPVPSFTENFAYEPEETIRDGMGDAEEELEIMFQHYFNTDRYLA